MSDARTEPDIVALLGATGSGKTSYLKRELLTPRPRRLLVWDFSPTDEYLDLGHKLPLTEILKELQASSGKPFGLVFKPSFDDRRRAIEFNIFCTAAYHYGQMTVVIEELRFVTQPSWAPQPWRMMVLTGRKRGLRILGTSQRPAHIDKDFLGNATLLHAGLLNYTDDVRIIAQELQIPHTEVSSLKPLQWIQRDRKTRTLSRGQIIF